MPNFFTWESGFDTQRILHKIAECRTIKDARVSFDSAEYHMWLPVLQSAVRGSSGVGHLKERCVILAVNDAAVTLDDPLAFLTACEAQYQKLLLRAKRKFVVVSSITYSGPPLFRELMYEDARIRWWPKRTSKLLTSILKARSSVKRYRESHSVPDDPTGHHRMLVSVLAYDAHDAHIVATDALDTMRAMLNLLVNSTRGINPFGRLARPHSMNRFRNGPFRTVHNEDGALATETFWYEQHWSHEAPTVVFKERKTDSFNKKLKGWWGKLEKNPLRDHVRQGLLRYCRALDGHEADSSMQEIWGALESLTGTQRERYDVTVDRTAKVFREREDARQIVNHIRMRRNASIHAARSINQDEADAILYQAELLASSIIFFCLREGHRFKETNELFRFFDMSTDEKLLERNIELSKFRIEYQRRRNR